MTDFPEPTSWNGGPDTLSRVNRSTGPRSEPPAVDYDAPRRGSPCHVCGRPVHRIYTLADVGIFCSPGCRSKATDAPSSEVA